MEILKSKFKTLLIVLMFFIIMLIMNYPLTNIPARAGSSLFDSQSRYWIFFMDKGYLDTNALQTAYSRELTQLSLKTIHRRMKTMGQDVVQTLDLPVFQPYIEKLQNMGLKIHQTSRWLNAVSTKLTERQYKKVICLPFVYDIKVVKAFKSSKPPLPDNQNFTAQEENFTSDDSPYNYGKSLSQLEQINVVLAHKLGFTGKGIIICMLDTGFRTSHNALKTRNIIAEWDFVNNDGITSNEAGDPPGQDSHGTGTFSVAGGFDEGNLVGPAFNAGFLLGKTENIASELPIEEDNWVAGIEWAELNGADILSSSLAYSTFDDGSGYSYDDLDGNTAVTSQAASIAASRGVLVVNAMGNEGPASGSLDAPADAFDIISCGAVDAAGLIADFSSRGPTADGRIKPELVARGLGTYIASSASDTTYNFSNGTSFSTPLIAGAAALVLQANPDWTPYQLRTALMNSGSQALHPDNTYGSGLLDVIAAIYEFPPQNNPLDADNSGRIDGVDLAIFSRAYQDNDYYDENIDIDSDGQIGDLEIELISLYFGIAE